MKTFLCYIHSVGVQTPQLRILDALDAGRLPDLLSEDMTNWPTLAAIELVEVYADDDELVLAFTPQKTGALVH